MGKRTKVFVSSCLSFAIFLCAISFVIKPINTSAQTVSTTVPNEYKEYINTLKQAHPNWNFEFLYTGLDWNNVISAESAYKVNMVYYSFPKTYRSIISQSYNGDTDTYANTEGSAWYHASPTFIKYCMDPRNFLDEINVFQFEKLSYDSNSQTLDGVKNMLKGSFMDGVYINNGSSNILYAEAYMAAAQTYNVSAYHLAARTLQEVGKNGSASTSGTDATYPGIYNFYNIGANTGYLDGLRWASQNDTKYSRPWNTQYKSIVGGASYIAGNYISVGQNSMYFEKFDVIESGGYYNHQYMANITAPKTEGQKVHDAYNNLGLLDTSFTFVIPVYNNFPGAKCNPPVPAGSPWCWLSSLAVDSFAITPGSTMDVETNNYSVTVPYENSTVSIIATPYKSTASVTGLVNFSPSSTTLVTGTVFNIDTGLNVRTSAGVLATNRLTYNGSYVQLSNGNEVKIIGQQDVKGQIWYNISFTYSGVNLTGWASGEYIQINTGETPCVNATVPLNVGDNVYYIKVTSPNGEYSRTYSLTITRSVSVTEPGPDEQGGLNTRYVVSKTDATITGISASTSMDVFRTNLGISSDATVRVLNRDGAEVSSGAIGTGMTMRITYQNITNDYKVIIRGDVNGDGEVDSGDLLLVRKNILALFSPSAEYVKAMDVNRDGVVDAADLLLVRKSILGLYTITQ